MKIVNCLQILKIFWTSHKITAGCKWDYRDWRGGGGLKYTKAKTNEYSHHVLTLKHH
jgi:hypothetical protein